MAVVMVGEGIVVVLEEEEVVVSVVEEVLPSVEQGDVSVKLDLQASFSLPLILSLLFFRLE